MSVAWSYSRLNKFRQCQLKSFWMDYAPKAVKVTEPPNPIFEKGQQWHKHMEHAISRGVPLPDFLSHLEPVVEAFRSAPEIHVEKQLAFTEELNQTSWFGKDVWCRVIWDAACRDGKVAHMADWKGLALDTPLPTPTGWATMGEVQEGDVLFDSQGQPCSVVGKSEVHHRPCFKITFDDTSSVVCDDEHLWMVNGEVMSTTKIKEALHSKHQRFHKVLVAEPLVCQEAPDLPIDPYVLGCWLGDGKHTSGEICKPDAEFWTNIEARGYDIGADIGGKDHCRASTVYGLRTQLRETGLLRNKHIPDCFKRASYDQRVLLLQGLMDSDGSVNSVRQQCIFSSTDKRLSDDVFELLCSLGQRPLQSTVLAKGFGLEVEAYPISFKPQKGLIPFALGRKGDRVKDWNKGHSWRRLIKYIDPVETVPTQCIAVDSPDHTYLCTKHMIPTHNTGKPRPDSDQLELFAASVFQAFPDVEEVHTYFVFLEHRKYTHDVFYRSAAKHIWQKFGEAAEQIVLAKETGNWEPCPGHHCKWCPVPKSKCQHSRVEG